VHFQVVPDISPAEALSAFSLERVASPVLQQQQQQQLSSSMSMQAMPD
jgi:hypothetical protein